MLALYFFVVIHLSLVHSTYDLIDPTPECYTLGLCTEYGEWGTYSSIHPNSEERTQQTFINLARMYPYLYINSSYGNRKFGKNGPTWTYDTEGDCAQAADIPYYWLSSINQASRFGTWDCQYCDDSSCGHTDVQPPE